MSRLNFSRQILPIIALVGIILAAIFIATTQPDRTLDAAVETPATPPAGARAVIAGAGVVEPSSELIEVGTDVGGVVDRLFVATGDRVGPGQPLFSVDSRIARAAIAEARARIARLRTNVTAAQTSITVARRQAALYASVSDPRAVSRQEVLTRQGSVDDAVAQLGVALASVREAQAQLNSAEVDLARRTVRASRAATVLQVNVRAGEFAPAGGQGGNNITPLMVIGSTDPLHVRLDIDENEIERVAVGQGATISPRGAAGQRTRVTFVRAEPLVVPKRSLTNSASERVDVRVLQLIYALPAGTGSYYVGQQVDGFVPAKARR
ncbi:efflux RND transporter periplasmic adaptor subunit [Sphingomonas sp.]|uniref:HlyD family secretion protein n=1 Tax=Sphingomonas sp. TaxID=28214 RepID=UPI00286D4990|nr:efflux RND transporter periplasmic adaptor subunit [Sphingomonas sp.]